MFPSTKFISHYATAGRLAQRHQYYFINFDVLLTVRLSIILVINQLDAQILVS